MSNRLINIVFLILFANILLFWGVFLPYTKAWEVGSLEFFARNHISYGLHVTKGIPLVNFIDGQPNYYTTHPPLVPLLLMLSFELFGVHEYSARLVPIIFSLIALLFFYLTIEQISGKKTALLAGFFMAIMPMFSYYGRIVNYEAVTLGLMIVFIYSFVKFVYTKRKVFLISLIIITVVGALSDWAFYLVFLVLPVYIKAKNINIKHYIGLAILALGMFVTIILMYNYAISTSLQNQFSAFSNRCQYAGILSDPAFYKTIFKRSLLNFTPLGVLFLFLWLLRLFKNKNLLKEEQHLFAAVLFLFGLIYVFITPQAAYIHDWSFQYLVPAVALISALVVLEFKKQWQIFFITLFIVFSLLYWGKLHLVKVLNNAYEAGRMISSTSSPGDILYTNAISPVCFYSKLETHFIGFGSRSEEAPDKFISTKSPEYICFLLFAKEPFLDYDKLTNSLPQNKYYKIYDQNGVVVLTSKNRI